MSYWRAFNEDSLQKAGQNETEMSDKIISTMDIISMRPIHKLQDRLAG